MRAFEWAVLIRRSAIAGIAFVALALSQQYVRAQVSSAVKATAADDLVPQFREVRLRVTVLDYDGVPIKDAKVTAGLRTDPMNPSVPSVSSITDANGIATLFGKTCLTCTERVKVGYQGDRPSNLVKPTRPDGTIVDLSTRGSLGTFYPIAPSGEEVNVKVRFLRPQSFPLTFTRVDEQGRELSPKQDFDRRLNYALIYAANDERPIGGAGSSDERPYTYTLRLVADMAQIFCHSEEQVQRFDKVLPFVEGGAPGPAQAVEMTFLRAEYPVSISFAGDRRAVSAQISNTIGDDDRLYVTGITLIRRSDLRMWTWEGSSSDPIDADRGTHDVQHPKVAPGEYLVMLGRFKASPLQLRLLNALEAGQDLRAQFPHVTVTAGGPMPEVVVDEAALLQAMKDVTLAQPAGQ